MLHQTSHWLYLANLAGGRNFLPFYACFWANLPQQAGLTLSVFMTFFVGVDRLIGVTWPLLYARIRLAPYLGACLAMFGAFQLYCWWLGVRTASGEHWKE